VADLLFRIVGNVLIAVGVLAVILGIIGVFRFRDFRLRLLSASKIDTVALLMILLGVALRSGVSWFAAKALLIGAVIVVANPVVTAQLAARQREDQRNFDMQRRREAQVIDEPLPERDAEQEEEWLDDEPGSHWHVDPKRHTAHYPQIHDVANRDNPGQLKDSSQGEVAE